MFRHYNALQIEQLLREIHAEPPFPPASDRMAWGQVQMRLGTERTREFIQQAEIAADEPIPALPASLWLECLNTGQREGYEEPCYRRRTMMRDLVLGECIEHQGRFIHPLLDVIWAICEESSWGYPAHHPTLADLSQPYIDLGAASTGFDLAAVDGLVGQELRPEISRRIRYEVNQRLLVPYLARHDFWWLASQPDEPVNNWTAVCNAGVMAAALYLEPDPARLADILAKGVRSLEDYLATFDEDGGSTEGPGYWSYGFGFYTLIAQLIEHRTGGRMTLMDGDFIRNIAAFPLRTLLSPGLYTTFSDAPREASFVSAMLTYLARRLNLPSLLDLASDPANQRRSGLNAELCWLLPSLFWDLPEPGGSGLIPARHDWYNGMMWMIARCDPASPDALVLAAKGGHNDEMHNHNDIGSFIVQINQEAVITDIGCGRYTLQYFGQERYDHFVTSSAGHPVPVANGQLQQAGRQFMARLLEHTSGADQDRLHLDLSSAYPPTAGLATLERRLTLHRPSGPEGKEKTGWVELEDCFSFKDTPGQFESVLTTFGQVFLEDGSLLLKGTRGALRVGYAPESIGVRIETHRQIDFDDGMKDVNRVVFSLLQPQKRGSIRLEIVPSRMDTL